MTQENDLQESSEEFELPPEALEMEEAVEAPAADAPAVATPEAITRERLEELAANPELMTDAEAAQVEEYTLGGKAWPEPTVVPTETVDEAMEREANEQAAAADEAETPAAEDAPDDDEEDDSLDARRARIQSVTELRAAHKAEMDRLNAILDKPEPEDDVTEEWRAWNKEQRETLKAKSKLQEQFQDALAEATVNGDARSVAVRESERFMASFDKVSARHPEVKLSRPFKVANAEYAGWLKKLVAESGITEGTDAEKLEAAYAKFQTDAEFAKKVAPPKDLQQVQILNAARELVEAVGGKRSLEGAVLEVMNSRGLLGARERAAAVAASQAAATKTQTALSRAAAAPVTAPLSGGSKTPRVLTAPVDLASASAYLTNLLDKQARGVALTKFETMYEDKAKEYMGLPKVR